MKLINTARYVEELCADALSSMGEEWRALLSLDLSPIMMATNRAVTLGLVLTELLININKYAYDGAAGPVEIRLIRQRTKFQLSVADRGAGKRSPDAGSASTGYGSRMMAALVAQLGGKLTYADNKPGLRAALTAPIEAPAAS